MWVLKGTALLLSLLPTAFAGFPAQPKDVTTLQSKFGDGVTISYKEVRQPLEPSPLPGRPYSCDQQTTSTICETTAGVRSYAGYVQLPPGSLNDLGENQSYPINTFFWFFESRKDPENAPLSIWMNGGKSCQ